jgi:integrase
MTTRATPVTQRNVSLQPSLTVLMTGDWRTLVVQWEGWLRAAGRPDTTIELRSYHIRRLGTETSLDPWTLTVDDLVAWLAAHSWAPETRRSYRASLRSFYSWAQATGRRPDSPAHLLPAIAVPRGRPRPAPDEVFRDAMAAADRRERIMMLLAASCGLRRGEIAKVRRDDLERDLVGWSLVVRGKGDHVRRVPLSDELGDELASLPPGWVFTSPRGGHLTAHHVGKLVSRLLPAGWTCHTLRHRCATAAYAATRDLRAVQELLGHAKPETTAIYTQVPDDAVRVAMRAADLGNGPRAA